MSKYNLTDLLKEVLNKADLSKMQTRGLAKKVGEALINTLKEFNFPFNDVNISDADKASFNLLVKGKDIQDIDLFFWVGKNNKLNLVIPSKTGGRDLYDEELDIEVEPAIADAEIDIKRLSDIFKKSLPGLNKTNEGMSDEEWADAKEKERLDNHPEGDKIKAVQALMAKEKAMQKEDAIEKLTAGLADEDGIKNNMKEDGVINITDPANPKLTSMQSLITNAIMNAYPSAEEGDVKDFYDQLMSNVRHGRVSLDGLDLGEEFEQFALDNNILLKDPMGGVREHFDRFK